MNYEFQIEGMSCQNCVKSVRSKVKTLPGYLGATVQLKSPQLVLETKEGISIHTIRSLFPSYSISEIKNQNTESLESNFLSTYKPLFLIILFITGVSLLTQYPFDVFSWMLFMRHFMAGFFIVFAFFKLLNLQGFANSYAMYDLLAAKWKSWGFIFPFLELVLGIAYLIDWNPQVTGYSTILLLGFSSLGVIKSNLDKRKIQCACLGDVFKLPMSVITVIEDLAMVTMAIIMLWFS